MTLDLLGPQTEILALRAVVALVVTWGALNALRLSPGTPT